jgi:hypothetical protein
VVGRGVLLAGAAAPKTAEEHTIPQREVAAISAGASERRRDDGRKGRGMRGAMGAVDPCGGGETPEKRTESESGGRANVKVGFCGTAQERVD